MALPKCAFGLARDLCCEAVADGIQEQQDALLAYVCRAVGSSDEMDLHGRDIYIVLEKQEKNSS